MTSPVFSAGRRDALIAAGLAALTLVTFGRVCGHDFVDYDDEGYVTANAHVRSGLSAESVRWAFTTTQECHWHPLTWLSLELDAQLYGVNPWGFHLTNLVLHLANTLLVFAAWRVLTGAAWAAAAVAGLFAVHPLHVETVAWVADRKDMLCALFWFLAVIAYARYADRPSLGRYLLVALAMALGLMAKAVVVTLPVVLLLLDAWPLRRMRDARSAARLVFEKLPLFVLSAASAGVGWYAQHREGVGNPTVPLWPGVQNAAVAYADYMGQVIWPVGLIPYYPLPESGYPTERVIAGAALVLAITVGCAVAWRRLPALGVGWGWFLVVLLPTIGIVHVLGEHARADRYTYVPLVGLFVAIVWVARALSIARPRLAPAVGVAGVSVLAACALASGSQVEYWRNSGTLWEHTIAFDPDNYIAQNGLGVWLARHGETDRGQEHFSRSLQANPGHGPAHGNLGMLLAQEGRLVDAVPHLKTALAVNSDLPAVQNWLGIALTQLGKPAEAEPHFREAVRLAPAEPGFQNNLGLCLKRLGRTAEAVECFETCLRLAPGHAEARQNLAAARAQLAAEAVPGRDPKSSPRPGG